MAVLVDHPWGAFAVAAFFSGLWLWRGARSSIVSCIAWLGYGGYEYLMRARVLCSGECNIRVDLFLVYPLLLGLSLIALWRALRRPPRRRGEPGGS